MEVDSPSESNILSPQDRILQRLHQCGVGEEHLNRLQAGLVDYVKENRYKLVEIIYAILPTSGDLLEALEAKEGDGEATRGPSIGEHFRESIKWLQWLMFEDDPRTSLKNLAETSVGQRGVCGAVWGQNDIAYRCRTCEHDPTCAICVPCFQNGNHKDHDYSLMYTGGGCCDCGDVTAWKREGFCSKHKGAEQIQPLSQKIANSVGPVLDVLLIYWKEKQCIKVANELTASIVEMLLEFCKFSESLLSFVSKRVFSSVGLLDVLVRAEKYLNKIVVEKLHELLLKLLGEPTFKFEFSKVFIKYYPDIIKEAIKECSDKVLEKYPLLSIFSVQIFTVPTLTPRLVKEMNLLDMLLGCLGDIFLFCVGEEGHIQIDRWASLYKTTVRLVEDTRYIMSHAVVPKYVTHEQPEISRTWIRLLAFVQGMDPQKRVTGLHVEEENEHIHKPFTLGHYIRNVHSLLVAGAFSCEELMDDLEDRDGLCQAKVGKMSQKSSVCSTTGRSSASDGLLQEAEVNVGSGIHQSVPSSVMWLTCECLRAIENWLGYNSISSDPIKFSHQDTCSSGSNFLALRKTIFRIRKGKSISKVHRTPLVKSRFGTSSELHGSYGPLRIHSGFGMCIDLENEQVRMQGENNNVMGTSDMDVEYANTSRGSDESTLGTDCIESEALGVLSRSDWPDIAYDVSSQDVSVHIPLHRLLSMLLQKALNRCYGESGILEVSNSSSNYPSSGCYNDFFGWVLGGCHPFGFSAFLMEHPLRIRVFCAEVRAGMWRKNGDAAVLSCELYRSVRWSDQGLENDLFLLQCCAALAPPDLFVKNILERFGLSNYLSLILEQSNEYEPVLVLEMLILIIQIVKERRFCGLSTAESLRRELIYKLAIGDATHSQLVKSLPHDLSKSDQLQNILDTVAAYSNPSGMKQGKYSLRKAHWKDLDLYHPQWSPRDLQVAEERYLRFCKVSALAVQLPRWMNVFYPLNGISRIATCGTVLKIVRAVLFYAVFTDKSSSSRAPDGILITALHLLSLALDICRAQRQSSQQSCISTLCSMEDSFPVLAFAGEDIDVEGTNRSDAGMPQSLLSLLVSLMRMHRREAVNILMEAGHCDLSSMIEYMLKKFAELSVVCMTKLKILAPEVVCHLWEPIPNSAMHTLGSTSDIEDRKAKARERQAAIMEKMRAAQSKFMESLESKSNEEADVSKLKQEVYMSDDNHISEEPIVCSLCRDPDSKSPLSFLVLLQKSRLASFVDGGTPSWERIYKLGKERISITTNEATDPFGRNILSCSSEVISSSHLVQLVQSAVDEFTNDELPGEVDAFLDFIKAQLPASRHIQLPSASHNTNMDTPSSIEMLEDDIYQSIQREMQDILSCSNVLEDYSDNSTSRSEEGLNKIRHTESVLLGKYIASLSRETSEQPPVSENARNENASSKSNVRFASFDGFGPADCDGIHISSCGHAVHQECRDRYLISLRERYIRRIIFEGGHVVDPDQGEFLCPVCRRLANSVLPAFPTNSSKVRKQMMLSDLSSELTTSSSTTTGIHGLRLAQALSLLKKAANMAGKSGIQKAFSLQRNEKMRPTLEPVFRMLCKMYFRDRCDMFSTSGRVSNSMIFWDTLKYSLISTEIAARCGRSKMCTGSLASGIGALYREFESSSGFILSLMFQVVQSTRSENSLQVLLRFRAIQLFAGSICSGVSIDQFSTGMSSQRGNISSVLKHADKGILYPDIQFWKRASDPVLAHDPFSSLMWILFSLPCPFLSSAEFFLSLVHLLYVVCVIQALITCCGHCQLDATESGFGDSLFGDICKIKGESAVAQQFFVSHYIDSSCNLKDMIRRFSHPYLRRCALLWKLLKSSTLTPFCDRSQQWDMSSSHLNNDILENTNSLSMELKEVEELETIFHIPDLDVILKDKELHALGLKWFHHFCTQSEVRNYGRVLHSTPAVPFRLMHLPHVYQDLLERYIKQQCPECKSPLVDPAVCLLCGKLCSRSPNNKSCCREGECHAHTLSCGAGIGVFLLIRKTRILLQRSARQAPWPSPYLDAFGEEDIEMQRGKPLYLNEERYEALTHMVASHGLDRSSEVLRQTTIESFFLI